MTFPRGLGVACTLLAVGAPLAAQGLAPEKQIAAAVLAAPEDMRAGATVLGYDAAGRIVELRKGTNDLICTADDPSVDGFEVSCYHETLEPYMARGRELRAQGVEGQARNETRWMEIDEKKLAAPANGATQHILTGEYDAATGEVRNAYLRWNVYTPYATPETTGLTTRGAESVPWLMYPGKPGAHIMIIPPRG